MSRILQWLQNRFGPPVKKPALDRTIDEILKGRTLRLNVLDPETENQWRRLKPALEMGSQRELQHRAGVRSRMLKPAVSFALAFALLLVGLVVWLAQPSTMTYETGRGEHFTMTLSDSTEVFLNHTSELIVQSRAPENTRRVALNGEAFFRVRRTGTPFIVSTDVATVQVLGTEFNVQARDHRLEVAVLSGSVRLSARREGADSSVVLTAGQIAVCTRDEFPGSPARLAFSEYPGWMYGKLIFYRTSLLSACREMKSQFDVDIRIEDPRLRNETITGMIDGRNVKAALATLANLTGSKIRYENSSYILY